MRNCRRYKRFGRVFLLLLAVLVGGLGWLTYRLIRQEKLNRALFATIYANQPEEAIRLLEEGADANARVNRNQPVSLHEHLTELWNRLRGQRGTPQTENSLTPLVTMYRPSHGASGALPFIHPENLRLLKGLLDKGADVNAKDEDGNPALMLAITQEYRDSACLLLDRGADVNVRDSDGITALMYAADEPLPFVQLLLAHGAEVNARNNNNYTALIVATVGDDQKPKVVQALLNAGAEVNVQCKYGPTALMNAASAGNYPNVQALLAHKADVNAKNFEGWTALMDAIQQSQNAKVVRLLLEYGADPNTKASDGSTPLTLAKDLEREPFLLTKGKTEMVQIISLLKQACAKE